MLGFGASPFEVSPNGGLNIACAGSSDRLPAVALRDSIVAGSADAAVKEVLKPLPAPGLGALAGGSAGDVADEDAEEKGRKTDPSTRFAVSRDASFLNSTRSLDGFLGSGRDGGGLRSNGTNPAGSRVIWIECGLRCRGRQGGSGSLAGKDLSKEELLGV